jgi:predicted unusual protein kinase regulating ubiquinone biosynthesis (AarF/ABC1/UbiB family)
MVQLDRPPKASARASRPVRCPKALRAVPFGRVRRVIEQDLNDRVRQLFADIDEQPFALASLGQVHRARTNDGARR